MNEQIKFHNAMDFSKRPKFWDVKTLAISANASGLIIHEFKNESEALKTMPYIKNWKRETFDKEKLRYHSSKAIKYWDKRNFNDPIHGTKIIHNGSEKRYEYY